MSYKYKLSEERSPSYYNLAKYLRERGWKSTRISALSHFNETQFNFDAQAAQCLEFKNLLAELDQLYAVNAMSKTFSINDQNWPHVLSKLAEEGHPSWILKPAMLNNGQNIKIFNKIAEIEKHYLQSSRMGGEHVLQAYIANPHLIKGPKKGHKYSMRLFVVLTNFSGAYLYPQGYFNIALQPYEAANIDNYAAHLTNEHLQPTQHNVIQIPTSRYADLFKPLYPQIKTITADIIHALQKKHPQAFQCKSNPALALFGFDFMADSSGKVWLLEANHAPCFPTSETHPLQQSVYHDFWQALIDAFVIPIAEKKYKSPSEMTAFEPLP